MKYEWLCWYPREKVFRALVRKGKRVTILVSADGIHWTAGATLMLVKP